MIARNILEHFLSRADWVDRNNTVDRIIVGDPEAEIRSCLVTWMPGFDALREAVKRGVDLVICHEPTFWDHLDRDPRKNPRSTEKLDFIEGNGIVIIRIHDSWDRWPEVGIPWAWARFLGLEGCPVEIGAKGYQHRYDIDLVMLDDFAAGIARRCASLGEPMVQVSGRPETMVSRIGIGTGCGCQIEAYLAMGCDCSVVCDDGGSYWSGIQMAKDLGHPVIRVNHGTSEEPGMVTLTRYVNEAMPEIRAVHLPHGAAFRLVGQD